jgi:hypothetical protein
MNPGRSLRLSDDQLAQLSLVTLLDIEAARALWTRVVPLRWKRLLESQTVGTGTLTTPFVWDAQSRRYIHLTSKRYVPFTEIREQAIEPLIRASKNAQRVLSAQLATGDTRLGDWQRVMMDTIKQTQVAAALASNGGDANSSQVDYKKIAAEILILYLLFRGFAEEIETGAQALNGKLLVRSDLYAGAARDIFEEVRRHGMALYYGAVQERRRLGRAEHCHTDGEREGCVELHDLGWVKINTLPRLGATPCRTNCKCRFDYRYQDEQGNWVLVDDSATAAAILKQLGVKEHARQDSGT